MSEEPKESGEWRGEGIDPRFTLANERTYLAWSRTSLALIAGGLGLAELLPRLGEHSTRRALGIPLVIVGGLIAVSAEWRRSHVQLALERGESVPRSRLPLLLTLVIVVLPTAATLVTIFD